MSYNKNGSGTEIIEENNFYPFGLKHEGYNAQAGNPSYNYQYNGKELQKETGWSDYGARMYISDIGRWGVIDPLAETSRRFTPYNYAYNNPIRFIDPDGRKAMAPEEEIVSYVPQGGMAAYFANGGRGGKALKKFFGPEDGLGGLFNVDVFGGGGGSNASADENIQSFVDHGVSYERAVEASNNGAISFSDYISSGSYFQGIDFTQFGADGGPGGPSAQLSNPIIGKKVLDAKTSFLGRLWANGQPRTWTENGITYNVDADGRITGVTPYQGDVPLGPSSGQNLFKGLSKENLKSISTYRKLILEHTDKLRKYISNPDSYDNLGILKNAPNEIVRNKIIQSRINHLQHEIKTFYKNIDKIINGQ